MLNISWYISRNRDISIEIDSLENVVRDTLRYDQWEVWIERIRNTSPIRKFVLLPSTFSPFLLFRRRIVELRICQTFAVNVKFRATRGAPIFVKADTKYKPRTCIGFHAAAGRAQKLVVAWGYVHWRPNPSVSKWYFVLQIIIHFYFVLSSIQKYINSIQA